jgi:hypothetical protein
MMEKFSREVQARRKAFSVVGRRARISYAWTRAGKRWFIDGSEIVRVQRRRIVILDGVLKGRAVGIGLVIWDGIGPSILCVRATMEYLTVEEVNEGGLESWDNKTYILRERR